MKRKILAVLTVLALVICALCSCNTPVVDGEGEVTVVIENRDGTYKEYTVKLEEIENKSEGAAGVLEYLAGGSDDPLELDMANDSYGKYINSVGSLIPDSTAGEYISVYTSVEADFGTFDGVGELKYKDTLLMSSGVGISSMQVPDGAIILFRIEVFNW